MNYIQPELYLNQRFKIETDAGIVGTVYVPKDTGAMPKRLILEFASRKES